MIIKAGLAQTGKRRKRARGENTPGVDGDHNAADGDDSDHNADGTRKRLSGPGRGMKPKHPHTTDTSGTSAAGKVTSAHGNTVVDAGELISSSAGTLSGGTTSGRVSSPQQPPPSPVTVGRRIAHPFRNEEMALLDEKLQRYAEAREYRLLLALEGWSSDDESCEWPGNNHGDDWEASDDCHGKCGVLGRRARQLLAMESLSSSDDDEELRMKDEALVVYVYRQTGC